VPQPALLVAVWLLATAVIVTMLLVLHRWTLNGVIEREQHLPDAASIPGDRGLLNRLNPEQLREVGRALSGRRPVSEPSLHPAAVASAHIGMRRAKLLRRDGRRAIATGFFAVLTGVALLTTFGSAEGSWVYWVGRTTSPLSTTCAIWLMFMPRMQGAGRAEWLNWYGQMPPEQPTQEAEPSD
jgi:hypothetical protein